MSSGLHNKKKNSVIINQSFGRDFQSVIRLHSVIISKLKESPKLIWNENDGIYQYSRYITNFPFQVNRTWNHIIVCYVLFSQLYPQKQFTRLLFCTADSRLCFIVKAGLPRSTQTRPGCHAALAAYTGERGEGLRFKPQVSGSSVLPQEPPVTSIFWQQCN